MNGNRFITYFILTAFLGLAVFGFAVMGTHDGMSGQANCIASIGQAALCTHQNTLEMAALHSDFFQRLTGAIILLALLAFAWVAFKKLSVPQKPIFRKAFTHQTDLVFAKTHWPFLRWLSLHEQVA